MNKEIIYSIFSKIPTLETERFILRKLSVDDTDDMYEYSKEHSVTKYLTWSPHPDKGCTLDYLMYLQSRYKTGDFFDWAIVSKENGKMIGTCGFTRFFFRHNSAEIGYVINPAYHGKGIATEVVGRVIKYGFENLALERIEGKYMVENTASRKVMEKNGMVFEGVHRKGMLIKGEYRDVGVCAIIKEDFFEKV